MTYLILLLVTAGDSSSGSEPPRRTHPRYRKRPRSTGFEDVYMGEEPAAQPRSRGAATVRRTRRRNDRRRSTRAQADARKNRTGSGNPRTVPNTAEAIAAAALRAAAADQHGAYGTAEDYEAAQRTKQPRRGRQRGGRRKKRRASRSGKADIADHVLASKA